MIGDLFSLISIFKVLKFVPSNMLQWRKGKKVGKVIICIDEFDFKIKIIEDIWRYEFITW